MAKPTQEDLDEFGSDEETGKPCVGRLIMALPEDQRPAYREKQRAFVREMTGRSDITYLQFLRGER